MNRRKAHCFLKGYFYSFVVFLYLYTASLVEGFHRGVSRNGHKMWGYRKYGVWICALSASPILNKVYKTHMQRREKGKLMFFQHGCWCLWWRSDQVEILFFIYNICTPIYYVYVCVFWWDSIIIWVPFVLSLLFLYLCTFAYKRKVDNWMEDQRTGGGERMDPVSLSFQEK